MFLTLVFAVSLAAQPQSIALDPPGPTSVTPIVVDLYVTCDPESHTLDRVGNVLKIHVTPGSFEAICDPPLPALYRVAVGTLPVGEYRVDVMVGARDFVETKSFVVRNGLDGAFTIHPFAVPTQPFNLMLRLDAGALDVKKVFVGDLEVSGVTYDDGAFWFTAPAHARGLVDVKVEVAGGATHTLAGALYYYDLAADPDPSVFERILFPVLHQTAGAHGSQWVSEAAIANPRPWYIETYNDVFPFVCLGYPCGERHSPRSNIAFSGYGYPNGAALIAPRGDGDGLAFSLRVRDTARQAEGYGTQVPVVRESQMFRGTDVTLLDLPVDPRYRTKVRMYAFDTTDHDAEVTVHKHSSPNTVFARYSVPVRRQCPGGNCEGIPWYGELDLPTDIGERVNVYVTLGHQSSPVWAFASITNNETQQVTVVTADGEGGRP